MVAGKIISLNVSFQKGKKKTPVDFVEVSESGIVGDAHSGDWHRQVSLLADESIEKMRKIHSDIGPGDFAENITTRGIALPDLPVGQRLRIGDVILEVTQIGKECHKACEIRKTVGDCVMPREGIFASVVRPGRMARGDDIVILGSGKSKITVNFRLWIEVNGRPFIGDGRVDLLSEIDKSGSLSKAAKNMGISYHRAHDMISDLNERLGEDMVVTTVGGVGGGGTVLTERGRQIVDRYLDLKRDLIKKATEFEIG